MCLAQEEGMVLRVSTKLDRFKLTKGSDQNIDRELQRLDGKIKPEERQFL
jgi:hypothetical protein